MLEEEPGSWVTLLYGNRRTSSVMFLEELADLKNRYPERLQLVRQASASRGTSSVHRPPRPRARRPGPAALAPVETVDEWYLCGFPAMVTGAQELLERAGVDSHHVHHEVFHVAEQESPRRASSSRRVRHPRGRVTVSLDGRSTRIEMPTKEETILDATLRVRPDAPYSCTGGVCGTCRARLVSGEVRMDRNYALEPRRWLPAWCWRARATRSPTRCPSTTTPEATSRLAAHDLGD